VFWSTAHDCAFFVVCFRLVGGPFEITLPAFPSVYMNKPKDLEDGDKSMSSWR